MDLETENRLASLLMEEARRLRAEADREGVGVYLRQPNIRGRPNSRFLTATVLGVEQANRAVQVNEMWRAREKELELEAKLKSGSKDKVVRHCGRDRDDFHGVSSSRREAEACRSSTFSSSSKRGHDDHSHHPSDEDGLKDDEVEEFLLSRAKRGRGAVGSRMDEPGPYPSAASSGHGAEKLLVDPETREKEDWESRILGPEKPYFVKPGDSPHEEARPKKKHRSEGKRRPREERSERRSEKERRKKKCKHRHHKSRRSRSDSQ